MSDEQILQRWSDYIADYEAKLAEKKAGADMTDPDVRHDIAMQEEYLNQMKAKKAELDTLHENEQPLPATVEIAFSGANGLYNVGGHQYSANLQYPPDGVAFSGTGGAGWTLVETEHFKFWFVPQDVGGTWNKNVSIHPPDENKVALKITESMPWAYPAPRLQRYGLWKPTSEEYSNVNVSLYNNTNYVFGYAVEPLMVPNLGSGIINQTMPTLFGQCISFDFDAEFDTSNPWDGYNNEILPNLTDNDNAVYPEGYEPDDPNNDTPDPEEEGFPDKSEINTDDGEIPDFSTFTTQQGSMTNFCVLTPAEYRNFRNTLAQTVKDSMNNDGQGSGLKTTFMYLLGKVKKDMNDQAEYETAENNFIKDYIVSCRVYPFDLSAMDCKVGQGGHQTMAQGDFTDIPFGFNGASITQHNMGLAGTHVVTYDAFITVRNSHPDPQKQLDYQYCTFLDYEPYTKYTLVLPFVGEVELSSHDVLCSTIYISYAIDFTTGTCLAIVSKSVSTGQIGYALNVSSSNPLGGSVILAAKTTTIGASMSIAGNDIVRQADQMNAAYVNQRLNRSVNALKQVEAVMPSKKQVEAALKEGGLQNALKDYALDQVLKIPQNMEMMAQIRASDLLSQIDVSQASRDVPFNMQGGTNPSVLSHMESPYMRIERASWFRPKNYAHTFGYPYEEACPISEINGFFQCSNPDVSGIACTEIEQKMINDALREGSYHTKSEE